MVLIISEEADYSTNIVINWLTSFEIKWVRLNENDELTIVFDGNDFKIINEDESFYFSDLKCVWYRRGLLNIKFKEVDDNKTNFFLKLEYNQIIEYIEYKISTLFHINKFEDVKINKLIVNCIARKLDLNVPNDLLFNTKLKLKRLNRNLKYSTKSVSGSAIFNYDKFLSIGYTNKINDFKDIPENFFPSLIQNYIDKKIELRIFYLNGEFWCMAIFSQMDSKTQIDFRRYNKENPNRTVPYRLPNEIQLKLDSLMKELQLNCGSIDMILSPENIYYFLEVNPIGQFGMVSNPCNYYLHREIALSLKNNINE